MTVTLNAQEARGLLASTSVLGALQEQPVFTEAVAAAPYDVVTVTGFGSGAKFVATVAAVEGVLEISAAVTVSTDLGAHYLVGDVVKIVIPQEVAGTEVEAFFTITEAILDTPTTINSVVLAAGNTLDFEVTSIDQTSTTRKLLVYEE